MARNRPRKGTNMKRAAGSTPVSPFAGLFTSSVTSGPTSGPGVTRDVTHSSTPQSTREAGSATASPFAGLFTPSVTAGSMSSHATERVSTARTGTREGNDEKRGVVFTSASTYAGLFTPSVTPRPRSEAGVTEYVTHSSSNVALKANTVAETVRQKKRSAKKRLLGIGGTLMSLVTVSSLVAGVTYARDSSQAAQGSNSLTAGSVSVGSPSVTQLCALSNVLPGNTTSAATLTNDLTSGSPYTSLAVTALAKAVTSGDKLLIGQGTSTQVVTASGTAALNATSISVTPFNANANYATGVMVTDLTAQNTPCTFSITYTGNLSGYVAADILVVGGTSSTSALWDNSTNGLQFVMTDGANSTYTVPSTTLTCSAVVTADAQFGSVAANGKTCGVANDDLLTTTVVTSGTTFTLSLNWVLPTTSPSSAQNGTAQVFVVFHAVQSKNNTQNCSPSASIGQPCAPTGTFKWS